MSKRIKTITMADLGNHVACYDCKHKDNEQLKLQIEELKECICVLTNRRKSGKTVATKVLNYDLLVKANEQLKQQLAEKEKMLKNVIVPKFNFGDTIFAVVTYIDDPKDKTVIESGIVKKIECVKNQIKYWCDNGRIYWEDEYEKLFATEQEAQQKLKELEERNEKVFI